MTELYTHFLISNYILQYFRTTYVTQIIVSSMVTVLCLYQMELVLLLMMLTACAATPQGKN